MVAGLMALTFCPARAAEDTPAAAAEREAAEEREKRINARMEDMEKTINNYEKRISLLNDDVRALREEISKLRDDNSDSQTRENIKRLKDAVEEVDKKRLEDNKRVMEALDGLQSSIKKNLSGTTATRPESSNPPPRNGHTAKPPPRHDTETGYEYTVMDGDTLVTIISKLRNAKKIRVTQKQMMDANPGVNWTGLQIGQKLFVPAQ